MKVSRERFPGISLKLLLLSVVQLKCVEGNIPVASGASQVEVPGLKVDQGGTLAVEFIAPDASGPYER